MGSADIFNDQKISKILKGSSTESDKTVKGTPKMDVVNQDFSAKPKRKNLFDEDDFDDFLETENKNKTIPTEFKKKTVNLFDETADDDDDIKPNPIKDKISNIKPQKPPVVRANKSMDKKTTLFDDDDDEVISKPKKISLFDDDDELFNDDDFFSNIGNTKLSSKLFDDMEEKSDNMFDIKYEQNKHKNITKELLNEQLNDEAKYSIANSVSTDDKRTNAPNLNKVEIKREENQTIPVSDNIIPKEANTLKSGDIFSKQETSKPKIDYVKKPLSLFDDDDSENDSFLNSQMKPELNENKTKGNVMTLNEENEKFSRNDEQDNLSNQLGYAVKENVPGKI